MPSRKRKKLVAFFEVRDEDGGPLELIDWPEVLDDIEKAPFKKRERSIAGTPHYGQVASYYGTNHLVFARARDDAVSSLDRSTGEILDTESDANKPWVEVSIASFLPGTNRFGYVLGTNASPRASTMASWLNRYGYFEEQLTVGPVISRDVLGKIDAAAEASLVKVEFDPGNIAENQRGSALSDVSRALQQDLGNVSVELLIRVKGQITERRTGERRRLLGAAQDLVGRDFKKAVAQLVNFDEEGNATREDVDFLQNRVTRKRYIDVTDQEGRSIRIKSAVNAIHAAADQLKAELYDLEPS